MRDAATRIAAQRSPAREAIQEKGWLRAHKWLLLRRAIQLLVLGVFMLGPLAGVWWVRGNLSSSMTLGVLPLTDPLLVLQSFVAGVMPYRTALIGAAIVAFFYALVGGRVFCGWICPVNIVTDLAAWLRRKMGLKGGRTPAEATRRWLLIGVLVVSAVTGSIAWEWVNPVSMFHRSLIFGGALAWGVVAAVFVYDLLVAPRGWCGHLCPMGAFYALLGKTALARITAKRREVCDDCMDCYAVCPEPQVIRPALKAVGQTHPMILGSACTTCGRCVDVCSKNVFSMTSRFNRSAS